MPSPKRQIGITRGLLPDRASTSLGRIGVANAARNLSESLSDIAFENLSKQNQREAAAAAQRLNFRVTDDGFVEPPPLPPIENGPFRTPSIYAETYTANVITSYGAKLLSTTKDHLLDIARQHKLDPLAFDAAATAYTDEVITGVRESGVPIGAWAENQVYELRTQVSNKLHDERRTYDDQAQAQLAIDWAESEAQTIGAQFESSAANTGLDIVQERIEQYFLNLDSWAEGFIFTQSQANAMKEALVDRLNYVQLVRDTRQQFPIMEGMPKEDIDAQIASRMELIQRYRDGKQQAFKLNGNEIVRMSGSQMAAEDRISIADTAARLTEYDAEVESARHDVLVQSDFADIRRVINEYTVAYYNGEMPPAYKIQNIRSLMRTDEGLAAAVQLLEPLLSMEDKLIRADYTLDEVRKLIEAYPQQFAELNQLRQELLAGDVHPVTRATILSQKMQQLRSSLSGNKPPAAAEKLFGEAATQADAIRIRQQQHYITLLNEGQSTAEAEQNAMARAQNELGNWSMEVTDSAMGGADWILNDKFPEFDYNTATVEDIQDTLDQLPTAGVLPKSFFQHLEQLFQSGGEEGALRKGAELFQWAVGNRDDTNSLRSAVEFFGGATTQWLKENWRPGQEEAMKTPASQKTYTDMKQSRRRQLLDNYPKQLLDSLYDTYEEELPDVLREMASDSLTLSSARMRQNIEPEAPLLYWGARLFSPGALMIGTAQSLAEGNLASVIGDIESGVKGEIPVFITNQYRQRLLEHAAMIGGTDPNAVSDGEINKAVLLQAARRLQAAGVSLSTTTVDYGANVRAGQAWPAEWSLEAVLQRGGVPVNRGLLAFEKAAQDVMAGAGNIPKPRERKLGTDFWFTPIKNDDGTLRTYAITLPRLEQGEHLGSVYLPQDPNTFDALELPPEVMGTIATELRETYQQELAERQERMNLYKRTNPRDMHDIRENPGLNYILRDAYEMPKNNLANE